MRRYLNEVREELAVVRKKGGEEGEKKAGADGVPYRKLDGVLQGKVR